MDPATMMAIANMATQFLGKQGAQGQQQSPMPQQQPQMQPKPMAPAALPPINTTDYGGMIKNMLQRNQAQTPIMAGMGGL